VGIRERQLERSFETDRALVRRLAIRDVPDQAKALLHDETNAEILAARRITFLRAGAAGDEERDQRQQSQASRNHPSARRTHFFILAQSTGHFSCRLEREPAWRRRWQ